MGELRNIVFNPATGLFEDSTNPTAHLTKGEIRQRRQKTADPMAAQMKPVIRALYLTGGERPKEGTTVEMSWQATKSQRVTITFPSGNTVEFPPVGSCQFVVPRQECRVRIVAHNGKYTTQRTLRIKPRKELLLQRFFKWIISH